MLTLSAIGALAADPLALSLDGTARLWVTTGIRPTVTGSWWMDGPVLRVDVAVDVPFGRFQLPVDVVTRAGARRQWIEVADGDGALAIEPRGEVRDVVVNPDGFLPVRGGLSRR